MRVARREKYVTAKERWDAFIADTALRAYIVSFCAEGTARPEDIVTAIIADDVTTQLDNFPGLSTQIQCVGTLMDRMVADGALVRVRGERVGKSRPTLYSAMDYEAEL